MNKFLPLLITLLAFKALAVTNLEFERDESQGKDFYSNITIGVQGEKGNQSSGEFNVSTVLAWTEKSSHFMAILDHEWQVNNDNINKNRSFFHIRYTKNLPNSNSSIELFLQGKRNRFQNIESRFLAGLGYRFSLKNEEKNRFNALGLGAFYESEHAIESLDDNESDAWRLNLYWHHKQQITDTVSIQNVIYYQPVSDDFNDYRVHDELRLVNDITKSLSYGFSASYSYDSEPLGTAENYDLVFGSFFKYTFQ